MSRRLLSVLGALAALSEAVHIPALKDTKTKKLKTARNVIEYDLEVQWTEVNIATAYGDFPLLGVNWNNHNPGPIVRVAPGWKLIVNLHNKMANDGGHDKFDEFSHPNQTNLHTHGLHVSSINPGDNIERAILPQQTARYEYEVPKWHPSGTLWLHAHRHGSTSLHVGGGAYGMLIVEDKNCRTCAWKQFLGLKEKQVIIQQIRISEYASQFGFGPGNPAFNTFVEIAQASKVYQPIVDTAAGQIKHMADVLKNTTNLGAVSGADGAPSVWLFNNAYQPEIYLRNGVAERWRFVHAGVTGAIRFVVPQNSPCDMWVVAINGVYLPAPHRVEADNTGTSPGDHFDMVFQCWFNRFGANNDINPDVDPSGQFRFKSGPDADHGDATGGGVWNGFLYVLQQDTDSPPTMTKLATLHVRGKFPAPDAAAFDLILPPQPDFLVKSEELPVVREREFNYFLDYFHGAPLIFGITPFNTGLPLPFSLDTVPATHQLGTRERWTIRNWNALVYHPFHVHVHWTKVLSVTRPNSANVDISWMGQIAGAFVENIIIPVAKSKLDSDDPTEGCQRVGSPDCTPGELVVELSFTNYEGILIQHCHFLTHEDEGLMAQTLVLNGQGACGTYFGRTACRQHPNECQWNDNAMLCMKKDWVYSKIVDKPTTLCNKPTKEECIAVNEEGTRICVWDIVDLHCYEVPTEEDGNCCVPEFVEEPFKPSEKDRSGGKGDDDGMVEEHMDEGAEDMRGVEPLDAGEGASQPPVSSPVLFAVTGLFVLTFGLVFFSLRKPTEAKLEGEGVEGKALLAA